MLSIRRPFYFYLLIILLTVLAVFYTFRFLDYSYVMTASQQRHQTIGEVVQLQVLASSPESDLSGQRYPPLVDVLALFPDLVTIHIYDPKSSKTVLEFGGNPEGLDLISEQKFSYAEQSLFHEGTSERWFIRSTTYSGEANADISMELMTDVSALMHASRPLQGQFLFVVIFGYVLLFLNLLILWKRVVRHQKSQQATFESKIDESNTQLEAAQGQILDAKGWKSRLLDNMSHELRTPLNAIIGYTEMVQEDLGENDHVLADDLNHVKYASKHLLNIISDLLDVAKLESGEMQVHISEFYVQEVIDDLILSVKEIARKNGNEITVDIQQNTGQIRTDLHKFRQSLFNILLNACKYTNNGKIEISVSRLNINENEHVVVSVSDTGIGMSSEQIDSLFEEFPEADMEVVRKYGGIGIGLTITRYLTLLLAGELRIESEKNKGTVVTLNFPVDLMESTDRLRALSMGDAAVYEPEKLRFTAVGHLEPDLDRRKQISSILVVDDDPTVREGMRRQLNQNGFRVVGASSGAEGLALAHQLRPDVITLDANLPGMDGWSVLKKLKSDPPLAEIPVVMLTFASNQEMQNIPPLQGVMRKPVLWPDYIDLIKECVRKDD